MRLFRRRPTATAPATVAEDEGREEQRRAAERRARRLREADAELRAALARERERAEAQHEQEQRRESALRIDAACRHFGVWWPHGMYVDVSPGSRLGGGRPSRLEEFVEGVRLGYARAREAVRAMTGQ